MIFLKEIIMNKLTAYLAVYSSERKRRKEVDICCSALFNVSFIVTRRIGIFILTIKKFQQRK
jgi:hypothetical protein